MDALLLIDTDDTGHMSDEAVETLGGLVDRTRGVGGILVFASTRVSVADRKDEDLSVFTPDEDDLVLRSTNPDIFEGIDDLAAGLHDLKVDRVVVAGVDVRGALDEGEESTDRPRRGAVWSSAMAALVCNFDVIVLSDAVVDDEGHPVVWVDDAEAAGSMVKRTADTWLRM